MLNSSVNFLSTESIRVTISFATLWHVIYYTLHWLFNMSGRLISLFLGSFVWIADRPLSCVFPPLVLDRIVWCEAREQIQYLCTQQQLSLTIMQDVKNCSKHLCVVVVLSPRSEIHTALKVQQENKVAASMQVWRLGRGRAEHTVHEQNKTRNIRQKKKHSRLFAKEWKMIHQTKLWSVATENSSPKNCRSIKILSVLRTSCISCQCSPRCLHSKHTA